VFFRIVVSTFSGILRVYAPGAGMKRFIFRTTFIVYLLIGLEILIMISPFAAFFYSLYSPVLNMMQSSRLTRWLTEFFLPHFVFLDDLLIQSIGVVQIVTFLGGMILFFYAAAPLYYCKFRRRGVLTAGIYEKIRHPQYLGLGIAGFGLLLYWPRFFILALYLTMLFVYYLLARNEEQRMLSRYADSYKAYMERVPMFLPDEIGGKAFRLLFRGFGSKGTALTAFYVSMLVLCLGAALLLRQYSVNSVNLREVSDVTAITVLPEREASVRNALQSLVSERGVKARIEREKVTLAYVMPSDFFLMALVTDLERLYPPDFEKPASGGTIERFFKIFGTYTKMQIGIYPESHSLKRIIFVRVTDDDGMPLRGKEVFRLGAKRYAAFHVDMDADSGQVLSIQDVQPRHKWGQVPMPVF
jgi:protein-S-isoprenylcysteine O-methyltransferase Ste14